MVEITGELRRHTTLPLMIQPNAGLPVLKGDKTIYPESPQEMAARAGDIIAAGASIIGGCCGTTPAHIRAMRKVVNLAMDRR
jgi:5-methyltetrahydrofolate--homocysteine methyltransferase